MVGSVSFRRNFRRLGVEQKDVARSARRRSGERAMLRLNNLRISLRIAIACLLPLIAFTVSAGKALLEKQVALSGAESIAAVAEAAPVISNLVHELQKERGASAGFINSKGAAFADTPR